MPPTAEASGPMDPAITGEPSYAVNPDGQTSSPGQTVETAIDVPNNPEAGTDAEGTAPAAEKKKNPEQLRTERLGIAGELSKKIKEREDRRNEERWGKGLWGRTKEKLNTTDWGKTVKVAGKIMLATTGVLAAGTLTGGVGLVLAPVLYSQALKLGFEGGIEGMQYLLRGRKERLSLEAKKQDFLKKSDDRIQKLQAAEEEFRSAEEKKDKGEITEEEYRKAVEQYSGQVESLTKSISRLESEYLKREREYINLENQMKVQRATESAALSAVFSLLMGVPLGVQGAGHNVVFAPGAGFQFAYKAGEAISGGGVQAIGTALTHTMGATAGAAMAGQAFLGLGLAGAGLFATAGKEIYNATKNRQPGEQKRGTSLWAEVSKELKAVGKKEATSSETTSAAERETPAESYEPPEALKKFAKETAGSNTEVAKLYALAINITGKITQRMNEVSRLLDEQNSASIPLIEKARAELNDLLQIRKETWQKIAELQKANDQKAAEATTSQTSERPVAAESSSAPSAAGFRNFYRDNAAGFAERERARESGQESSTEQTAFDEVYREINRCEDEMRQKEREMDALQNQIDRGETIATGQVREQLFRLTREYLDADRRRDTQKKLLQELYNGTQRTGQPVSEQPATGQPEAANPSATTDETTTSNPAREGQPRDETNSTETTVTVDEAMRREQLEAEKTRLSDVRRRFDRMVNSTTFNPEDLSDPAKLKEALGFGEDENPSRKAYEDSAREAKIALSGATSHDLSRTSALFRNLDRGFHALIRIQSENPSRTEAPA